MTSLRQTEQQQKLGDRNGTNNNCMDITSDKQAKSHEKTWIWLRKRYIEGENEYLLKAAKIIP